jgi:hypothetical protein
MNHERGGPGGHDQGRGPGDPGPDRGPQHCGGPGPGPRGPEDRIAYSARAWRSAFDEAMHELRVDLIKEEIRALWGTQLQATAKGAAASMHADWKKYWTENKEELEAELGEPERQIRDVVRQEIKKNLGAP